ncbi:hypothetical protein F5Y19DRAFT_113508 [Xylariaceae sp. FL1651]|nr:hypothetical protein F5Y19DRAFT_113508 [Xylariaceae sp. FL1651]
MTSNHSPISARRAPPRPQTPVYYIPTPNRTIAHADTFEQLLNERQRSEPIQIQTLCGDRFLSFGQLPPPSPATTVSSKFSSRSTRSALQAARKGLTRSVTLGRAAFEKTRPAIEAAIITSKKAAAVTRNNLDRLGNASTSKSDKTKTYELSRSSSKSSAESLYHMKALPKLIIPDTKVAVEEALNSTCSTETLQSPGFQILESSPTSRSLRHKIFEDHPEDAIDEFRNILTARRRVRKGKFGRKVTKYCEARPMWDNPWGMRGYKHNSRDNLLLKDLIAAVQKQKDYAAEIVQRRPDHYPGFRIISEPGITRKFNCQLNR